MAPNADNGTRRDCRITTNNYLAMNKYKPLSLAAILALMFTLSACSEQLLETVTEDPEPDTTSGEADYVTSQVLAQNTADDERSPQANDITLGSYNNSDTNTSNDIIGQSNLMPIRIPFSGAITNLYNSDGSLNDAAASAYTSNIVIIETPTIATSPADSVIVPLPIYDQANNSLSSNNGTFRAVYQDANNDLVLVPGSTTFKASTDDTNYTYFVLVHKDLNGADGQSIIPDTLTKLLTTDQKLIDDANTTINSTILEDINDNNITNDVNDTASVASLEASRRAYVGVNGDEGMRKNAIDLGFSSFTSASDIASVFHFTTAKEGDDSDDDGISDTTEDLNASLFKAATYRLSDDDISWLNADLNDTSATPINIKSQTDAALQDLGLTFEMDFVNALYKGFMPCTNYLQNAGIDSATGSARWELNLTKNETDSDETNDTALEDCPNSLADMDGNLGFWAAQPATTSAGLVIFQHGITSHKDSLFYIINTFAEFGYSSIAIDAWGHGERGYEDGNANGTIENTMADGYADSGLLFIRPDAPDLSAGYYLQTLLDIYRVAYVAGQNTEIQTAIAFADPLDFGVDLSAVDGTSNTHYVGVSLGGIMGATLSSILDTDNQTIAPFGKYVLNVPGGDVTDIVFNGSFGPGVRNSVATAQGYDTSTVEGQQSLNSTMVAIDLLTSHTFFTALMDPLVWAQPAEPTNVLLQEIVGDATVPNSNTELLAQSMNLIDYADGGDLVDTTTADGDKRLRWTFTPSNYVSGSDTPGHGFLLDSGDSNASDQAQKQVGCYLRDGVVPDPTKTINTTSVCSNN